MHGWSIMLMDGNGCAILSHALRRASSPPAKLKAASECFADRFPDTRTSIDDLANQVYMNPLRADAWLSEGNN